MAKLHVICGNCGCNDMFEFSHSHHFIEGENHEIDTKIVCKNCATNHYLGDNAKYDDLGLKKEVEVLQDVLMRALEYYLKESGWVKSGDDGFYKCGVSNEAILSDAEAFYIEINSA